MASVRLSSRFLGARGTANNKSGLLFQNGANAPAAASPLLASAGVAPLWDSFTISSVVNMVPAQMRRLHYGFTDHHNRRNVWTDEGELNLKTHQASLPLQPRQRRYSTAGAKVLAATGSAGGAGEHGAVQNKIVYYGKAKIEHKLELVSLWCDSFVHREPIALGLGVTKEDFMTWAPLVVDELTAQGDAQTGKVVGFFLNEMETLNATTGTSHSSLKCRNEKLSILMHFLRDLDEKADPYKTFQVDKLFRFQLVAVDVNYGNLGIAKRLTDMSMEIAIIESDSKVGVVACTGKFSQVIFSKMGFYPLATMDYASYRLANGEAPFDLKKMGIHVDCKIMGKHLK